ncbi:MAG: hypothetical protein K2N69_09505, partial [Helicobacter sp.]|nr:hypothetical protein [Helicobacter sp.]
FRLDNYDVFLEKSPRGIYTLSAISDNGNEIVLLKQSEPPKNLTHYAQKLIEQSSAAKIETRIAQREAELKSAREKLKSIEQSTTGKEIATLEAKEKELNNKIAKLIKEMSAQPKNATKEEIETLENVAEGNAAAAAKNAEAESERIKEIAEAYKKKCPECLKDPNFIGLEAAAKKMAIRFPTLDAKTAVEAQTLTADIMSRSLWHSEEELGRFNVPEERRNLEQLLKIEPIAEFGTNYAEYYGLGAESIRKLLREKQGQVAGAFYREELGDITLAWGEVTDARKHKGYGLAHILNKHPKFDVYLIAEIVEKGKLNIQNDVRARLEYGDYVVGLSREFKGEEANFIITAFEKNNGNKGSFSPKPKITDESDNVSPTHAADSTPPNIKGSLESGETHESLQQQLADIEQQLATNAERIDKSMPKDKPKLREIHRELLDKKKQIKAEIDKDKAIEALQNRKAENRSEAMSANWELASDVGLERFLKLYDTKQQKA